MFGYIQFTNEVNLVEVAKYLLGWAHLVQNQAMFKVRVCLFVFNWPKRCQTFSHAALLVIICECDRF